MSKEPKIEKNVPLPPRMTTSGKERLPFYDQWLKLKPGDSMFYEVEPGENLRYMQQTLLRWKRAFLIHHKLKWEMATRLTEDGCRIWRVK